MERPARNKHSSLLQTFDNVGPCLYVKSPFLCSLLNSLGSTCAPLSPMLANIRQGQGCVKYSGLLLVGVNCSIKSFIGTDRECNWLQTESTAKISFKLTKNGEIRKDTSFGGLHLTKNYYLVTLIERNLGMVWLG